MKTDIHILSYLPHFFLELEIFQTKVVEKTKTHILCSVTFSENRDVYGIMWKYSVERGRPQIKTWHMRIACWIPKAINTHSQCVTFIAFPLQQWLHERVSMLRYTQIDCIVIYDLA
jgi:hypothetical protein